LKKKSQFDKYKSSQAQKLKFDSLGAAKITSSTICMPLRNMAAKEFGKYFKRAKNGIEGKYSGAG
jgi:hypothetical protein